MVVIAVVLCRCVGFFGVFFLLLLFLPFPSYFYFWSRDRGGFRCPEMTVGACSIDIPTCAIQLMYTSITRHSVVTVVMDTAVSFGSNP